MPVSAAAPSISVRLQTVTEELRRIQELLADQQSVDPSILTDFRDSVNRVRNTAWAVEQFANSQVAGDDPRSVMNLLALERIRVAYQLCKLIEADAANPQIQLQKPQTAQFVATLTALATQLDALLER